MMQIIKIMQSQDIPCIPHVLMSDVLEKTCANTNFSLLWHPLILWDFMLKFFGTYYGSLRGRIEAIFQLSIPIYSFENDDVYDCQDNIDKNGIMKDKKEDVENSTNFGRNVDNTFIQPLRITQSSIEEYILAIGKL